MLRRWLLGWLTALVVARPMVPGEDPGRLAELIGPSELFLAQLWLLAAFGWGVWRLWSGQGSWQGSLVEAGLLVVVGCVFASAAWAARYKHPAWLIAWEWAVLLVAFCLIRQLVRSPAENRGMLAVVLATGVTQAVHAGYQHVVQAEGPVAATFADPRTFAGYLVLLAPILCGILLASGRLEGWSWRTRALAGCFVLLGYALWLTGAWAAWAALFLVTGLGIVVRIGRSTDTRPAFNLFRGLAALGVLGSAIGWAYLSGRAAQALEHRWDYWRATWAMIGDAPLLGVGPGNFSRLYLRHMSPASNPIHEPHNFLLETWACAGLFALGALAFVLIVFFRKTGAAWIAHGEPGALATGGSKESGVRSQESGVGESPAEGEADESEPAAPPWEFYLGGVGGLLLSFMLRSGNLAPDDILTEGLVAGVRSLFWFALFALFEGVDWTGPSRVRMLSAGVAALLVYLLVTGGFFYPSLAQPLWIVAALTLNALPEQAPSWEGRHWLGFILPLPLLVAVPLTYFLLVVYPVTTCSHELRAARSRYEQWEWKREPDWQHTIREEPTPETQFAAANQAVRSLLQTIINPLFRAARNDPRDIAPHVELARWYGKQWELLSLVHGFDDKDPKDRDRHLRVRGYQFQHGKNAIDHSALAQRLDPEGTAGYLAEYRLRRLFAEKMVEGQAKQEQDRLIVLVLSKLVERDPTNPHYRIQLADAYAQVGEPDKSEEHYRRAARLHRQVPPRRQLTRAEQEKIKSLLE